MPLDRHPEDYTQFEHLKARIQVKKKRLEVLNPLVDQICEQLSRHGQDPLKMRWRDEMERLFGIGHSASSQIGEQKECIENEDDFEYLKDHLTQLLYILRNPSHVNLFPSNGKPYPIALDTKQLEEELPSRLFHRLLNHSLSHRGKISSRHLRMYGLSACGECSERGGGQGGSCFV